MTTRKENREIEWEFSSLVHTSSAQNLSLLTEEIKLQAEAYVLWTDFLQRALVRSLYPPKCRDIRIAPGIQQRSYVCTDMEHLLGILAMPTTIPLMKQKLLQYDRNHLLLQA